MSLRSVYATLSTYEGFCVGCCGEQDYAPLVVTEHGPRGLRAWLSGVGPQDRALAYTCVTCGRIEHVPHTDAEDDEYAATLLTWPDWSPVSEPVALQQVAIVPGDVFALAAVCLLAAPVPAARSHTVRVITLPVQRVHATDDHLVALSA